MKLATYQDGSRDGQLLVVSRDLASAHFATDIATRLQQLLDDWNFIAPQLEALYLQLNQGKARHAFAFDARLCLAPLPRASAHLALTPAPQRCASDGFIAPHPPACAPGTVRMPGLAAITGDIAAGASAPAALEGVRLWMLADDRRAAGDADDAVAQLQAQLGTCFGPIAATPDELGNPWPAALAAARLDVGGASVSIDSAGLGSGLAALVRSRPLQAGTIVRLGAQPVVAGAAAERVELRLADGSSPLGSIDSR